MARKRFWLALALLVAIPFAACAPAEEPVEEPAEEQPAEAPTEAPAEQPMEEPAPEEPAEPQLEGSIEITGDTFEWTSTGDEAGYHWQARITNDTTATLEITVQFKFLDESGGAVKTETISARLAPAQSRTVSGDGTMTWDDANRVSHYECTYTEYDIVTAP